METEKNETIDTVTDLPAVPTAPDVAALINGAVAEAMELVPAAVKTAVLDQIAQTLRDGLMGHEIRNEMRKAVGKLMFRIMREGAESRGWIERTRK